MKSSKQLIVKSKIIYLSVPLRSFQSLLVTV